VTVQDAAHVRAFWTCETRGRPGAMALWRKVCTTGHAVKILERGMYVHPIRPAS
jgi:hypothetical protein